MNIIITGKNMEISDLLRNYVEKKANRLSRYLPRASEVRVELRTEGTKDVQHSQVAEITLRAKGTILRSEERSADIFASVDTALDKMYRRVMRYKTKRYKRGREEKAPTLEAEEASPRIVRTKRFPIRPMDEEEAVEQMELLGHDFFLFYNVASGQINLLYRRRDGNYGLIEPEE